MGSLLTDFLNFSWYPRNKGTRRDKMDDLFSQLWFLLRVAWSSVKYEISNHVIFVVAVVTLLFILKKILVPSLRR